MHFGAIFDHCVAFGEPKDSMLVASLSQFRADYVGFKMGMLVASMSPLFLVILPLHQQEF